MENQNAIQCTADNTAMNFMIQQQQSMIEQQKTVLAMMTQLNAINSNVTELAGQIVGQDERLSSLEAKFAPSTNRLMTLKVYVENALRRNILANEVISFEIQQEGVRVLLNTNIKGLSQRLRGLAKCEKASISEVQTYNHRNYYSEQWLAAHVKPLG